MSAIPLLPDGCPGKLSSSPVILSLETLQRRFPLKPSHPGGDDHDMTAGMLQDMVWLHHMSHGIHLLIKKEGEGVYLCLLLVVRTFVEHSKPWLPSSSSPLVTSCRLFWTGQAALLLGKLQGRIQDALEKRKSTNMTF